MVRVAVYWNSAPGYLVAGLHALASRGHEVRLGLPGTFDTDDSLGPGVEVLGIDEAGRRPFDAEIALYCGWHLPEVNRALALHDRAAKLLYFDTQWRGTARQRVRLPVGRRVLPARYSHAFVPGERQAVLARRLGFPERRILWGACTFEERLFAPPPDGFAGRAKAFVFAGRLVPEKAVDVLLDAYRVYRSSRPDPWPLLVAGHGPLASLLEPRPEGVELLGHLDPARLSEVMRGARTFVLPSRFEPYGIVVQEAAATGMSLIASSECGSSTEVLQPGYNGWLVEPGSTSDLSRAMGLVHDQTDDEAERMSRHSHALSAAVAPDRWADSLLSALDPQG